MKTRWPLAMGLALSLGFALAGSLSAQATEEAAAPPPEQVAVVQANNTFAVDLYARLCKGEGNLFFSPYSISTALAMTYTGARGKTAEEMAAVLHLDADVAKVCAGYTTFLRHLHRERQSRDFRLYTANALWGQQGYPFARKFISLIRTAFNTHPISVDYHRDPDGRPRLLPPPSPLLEVDFQRDPEGARKIINRWVAGETQDKIKDLIPPPPPPVLTPATCLVLTNAIYFKAAWAEPFKKDRTQDGPFHLADGRTVSVPLMSQTHDYCYADVDGLQVLDVPYEKQGLSMTILLPRAADGLAKVEASLTSERLDQWLDALKNARVDLTLPKFKMTAACGLDKTLSAMGMPTAFDSTADFSGMDGKGGLYISAVIHKAYVDVDETGTEAAAATAVVMPRGCAMPPQKGTVVFRADHPFVFLIRDTRTGTILFMGRVANPKP